MKTSAVSENMADRHIVISVAVPLFNEEESAPVLYDQLKTVLEALNLCYEIIIVDDGSSDKTFEGILDIAQKDPCLRFIKFRRNFGQTPAMAAGIDHARVSSLGVKFPRGLLTPPFAPFRLNQDVVVFAIVAMSPGSLALKALPRHHH